MYFKKKKVTNIFLKFIFKFWQIQFLYHLNLQSKIKNQKQINLISSLQDISSVFNTYHIYIKQQVLKTET